MRHKNESRDATFPLVLIILAAIVVISLVSNHSAGETARFTAASTSPTPSGSTPSASGSGTPAHAGKAKDPAPQQVLQAPAAIQRKPERNCVPRTGHGQLTVLTYNIHSALGDKHLQLEEIAHELELWDADVVLLQEVDKHRAWTQRIDMPAWFGARLGMDYAFGPNVVRGISQYGTAILSRYPIVSSENTHLPNRPGMQQRGLLHVTIAPDGVPLSIYDTHLQNRSEPMRLVQIRAVNQILAADPAPKILGGDFNSQPMSSVMMIAKQVMSDTWEDVGVGTGFTHPARHPMGRIDYLLHAGDIDPLSADVLDSSFSDHRIVRATYGYTFRDGQVCLPRTG